MSTSNVFQPRILHDHFSIDRGTVEFRIIWHGVISKDDVADIKDWLKLVERRLDRIPTVGPNEESSNAS